MFSELCRYNRILVTGPARSGTHVCSRMIAHDAGMTYVSENAFRAKNQELFRRVVRRKNVVIACAGMRAKISEFSQKKTLIVFMHRPIEDIIASGLRIGGALKKFKHAQRIALIEEAYRICLQIRYAWLEVEYDSLAERVDFLPTQTS